MFENLNWQEKKVVINNLDFWLQVYQKEDIRNKKDAFVFYKDKKLIDMYETFFDTIPADRQRFDNIMEIGMWDGGSAVFWHEILKPKKMIGIDLLKDGGTEIYKKYKTEHPNTFFDYWDTSQTDKNKLTEILNRHLAGEDLDLVFDDASHRYHQSLDSFNIVFPYLKKGGYYIIEDWAWGHWLHENSDVYPAFTEPTRLVTELIEASANIGLIENIHICSGFTAVKRGQLDISKDSFNLHNHILRRPVSLKDRLKRRIKILLGRSW